MLRRTAFATLTTLALAATSFSAIAADHVFSNTGTIDIPDGAASPYPSTIAVSGLSGNVTSVSVTLNGLSHTWPRDIDLMVVSPDGHQVMLMSDVGGYGGVAGLTLTFSANAAAHISSDGALVSGTYLPTDNDDALDYGTDTDFPAPAPADTSTTDLTTFNGTAANASGSWSLYVFDDLGNFEGSINTGWSLAITTEDAATCASEGYKGAQLTWCRNICENGLTGAVLDTWIHRWIMKYRKLPYCGLPTAPPPQGD